jgi:predicted AAA+ superfamily ATPase
LFKDFTAIDQFELQVERFPSTSIVHINFFENRLQFLKEHGLSQIIDAYYQLFPEKKIKETVYFFLEEIQTIPKWEQS